LENEHAVENVAEELVQLVNFEEGSARRRLQRMTMWRRMMLKRLCRWWIFGRRGSLCRILRLRSKSGAAYGILGSWKTLILSALR
jgi:hypothetical protein